MKGKIIVENISIYALFFLTCIFIFLPSPFAPGGKSLVWMDSSVFVYVAQQILDGDIVYKDIADHKGPFLYAILASALFLFKGEWIGIWIFEIVSLFATSVIFYKTARLFAGKKISTLSVMTSILFLIPLMIGGELYPRGNLTEEWALPYIAIAQYIFIRRLKDDKKFTIIQLLILSLTFVLTFMLRANLVALWVGYGIIVIWRWISMKRFKEMITNISFILLFIVLSVLPFFLYFHINDALSDALYWVFKFNISEYASPSIFTLIGHAIKLLIGVRSFVFLLPLFTFLYFLIENKKILSAGVLSSLIVTIISCSQGYSFEHYFIIFAPILLIVSIYFYLLSAAKIRNRKYIGLSIIILFLCFSNATQNIYDQIRDIYYNYSGKEYSSTPFTQKDRDFLVEKINEYSLPSDKILIRGYGVSTYLYSKRKAATRFIFPIAGSSLVEEHYLKDIERLKPKLIIQGKLVHSHWGHIDASDVLNNQYEKLPIGRTDVEIWLLKDE